MFANVLGRWALSTRHLSVGGVCVCVCGGGGHDSKATAYRVSSFASPVHVLRSLTIKLSLGARTRPRKSLRSGLAMWGVSRSGVNVSIRSRWT
jgi:hypothetical protein